MIDLQMLSFPTLDAWFEALRTTMPQLGMDPALMPAITDVADRAPPAVAFVNHGRWLARCPDGNCQGVEYVGEGLPFWCCACANVGAAHRWRLVEWPPNRAAIEAALGRRDYPHQRNWLPGESIQRLDAETRLLTGVIP